jgi:glucosyl-dolichyl phosphate glucuronosyltransferase
MVKISCILPTRNRGPWLGPALRSLAAQNVSPSDYEILVIDNDSSDHTAEVVDQIRHEHPQHRICYLHEPVPGLLSGRHRGAIEAKGELLVFVDDDIEATAGWLAAIAETFEDLQVQIVGGRNLPKYEVDPPQWLEGFWSTTPYGGRSCHWLSLLDLGEQQIEINPGYVWGLNFSIRRDALFELGGFHPDCIPDHLQCFQGDGETGLTLKAHERGCKAVYQPRATVYHHVPAGRMTPTYFDRRAYYQGVCDSYTELRRNGCVSTVEPSAQTDAPRPSAGGMIRRAKRYAVKLSRGWKKGSNKLRHPGHEGVDFAGVNQRAWQAHKAGYQFHQDAVRGNPKLLAWVLKADYWDYELPVVDLREAA